MKRWIITVSTDWCGEENSYRIEAESESDIYELADELAYDNWEQYCHLTDIAEELNYDVENMTEEDWDDVWDQIYENPSWYSSIEEFEGSEEEWNNYEPAY